MMLIGKTKSICPVCLSTISAEKVLGSDKKIYMKKICPEHGEYQTMIWEGDLRSYLSWGKEFEAAEYPVSPGPVKRGCPLDCGYCEEHQSKGCCVLLEVTGRCNLKCPVCFASAGETEGKDPSLQEIERMYDHLLSHGGPFNIQLSGGEPTMREDLPGIIRMGRKKGFTFFQLNTNGLRLAEEDGYAEKLKEAGLNTVFLQFDGVSDEVYRILRGRPLLEQKKQAVRNCARAGLGVVLVPVIVPYVNENQIGDILSYALRKMPYIRGVHFQPVSYFGRCSLDVLERGVPLQTMKERITIPRMLREIETQTGGQMKAEDFAGGGAENPYCSFHGGYLKQADGSFKALGRRASSSCCCVTSDSCRESVSDRWNGKKEGKQTDTEIQMTETSSLDQFLAGAHERTFTVSGMIFQDVYNIDLARLKRCFIAEMDPEFGMVPFCAYNLTSLNGEYLYRGRKKKQE